ncbi:hypothetical protein U1Q18_011719 [Sarracenia purpurea var. burkii]
MPGSIGSLAREPFYLIERCLAYSRFVGRRLLVFTLSRGVWSWLQASLLSQAWSQEQAVPVLRH